MALPKKRRSRPRTPNLRIEYDFDRAGYVGWRVRCWASGVGRRASVYFRKVSAVPARLGRRAVAVGRRPARAVAAMR